MSTTNVKFIPTKCCEIPPEDIQFPVYATPKIDGVNGVVLDGKLYARSMKPFKNKQLNEVLSRKEFSGLCFEITVGKLQDRCSDDICRRTTSYTNSIDKQVSEITISVFDFVGNTELICDKPYLERMEMAYSLDEFHTFFGLDSNPKVWVKTLVYKQLDTPQEVVDFYEKCLEKGLEGAIFRNNKPYKQGRSTAKSQETLRMKPQPDSEAVIVGFIEAQQNNNEAKVNELGRTERSSHKENKVGKGMLGSFLCVDSKTGNEITVGAGKLTHDERIDVWNNQSKYLGKILKYRSMSGGVKDKPRFPRFIDWRDLSDMDEKGLHKDFLNNLK